MVSVAFYLIEVFRSCAVEPYRNAGVTTEWRLGMVYAQDPLQRLMHVKRA